MNGPVALQLTLAVFIFWVLYEVFALWLRRRTPRSEFLNEAAVARQMCWRLNKLIEQGDQLFILSYDANYFGQSHKFLNWLPVQLNVGLRLTGFLRRWLLKGCKVSYFAVSGEVFPGASSTITSLESEFTDKFELYKLDLRSEEAKSLSKQFETFHPTILVNADGEPKALWIEHYHAKGSFLANSIEFVIAPEIKSEEYIENARKFLGNFEVLKNLSTKMA